MSDCFDWLLDESCSKSNHLERVLSEESHRHLSELSCEDMSTARLSQQTPVYWSSENVHGYNIYVFTTGVGGGCGIVGGEGSECVITRGGAGVC